MEKYFATMGLLTLLLAGPALAIPKSEGHKLRETLFTSEVLINIGSSSQGEQMTTGLRILHVKEAVLAGYIETGLGPPISGSVSTILSGLMDLVTMSGSFNGRWNLVNDVGMFEGSVFGIIEVANVSGRFVGSGSGDFGDCRIRGSFEGTVNNYVVDLTLRGMLTFRSSSNYFQIPTESEIVGK